MITLNPAKFKCDMWTDHSLDNSEYKESKPTSQTSTDVTLNNMSINHEVGCNDKIADVYNNNPNL